MSIKVLIVDDNAVMRKLLVELIGSAPDMVVLGSAPDALIAREMIKTLNPDVLTLDVQMPKMGGIEFLERLMRLRPMPVVMVSSFTQAGSDTTLRALELGAVDFIGKPRMDSVQNVAEYAQELLDKIRAAYGARLRRAAPLVDTTYGPKAPSPHSPGQPVAVGGKIVFLGASTGGTEAIKDFLLAMPADCPPILIVQHMPENFTASFAARLDGLCQPHVIEARGGERVETGMAFIARGDMHLQIRRSGSGYVAESLQTPPVNRHRPSVDVLFDSAADVVGHNAFGVILTGMGKDGAQGLLRMREAGARTFGQDEASCVVYGMPREAAVIGAVEEACSPDQIARRVLAMLGRAVA